MLAAALSLFSKSRLTVFSVVISAGLSSSCSKSEPDQNSAVNFVPAQPVSEQIDELTPRLDEPAQINPTPPIEPAAIGGPKLAIIIDDIGYNEDTGLRAAKLPSTITLSVLPFSPNGASLAKIASANDKEIMLHAPMSTISARPLDPGGLNEHMDRKEFVKTLNHSLDALDMISGVNNHMGSLLTQKEKQMRWLMDTLKAHSLYFIDSRTSPDSLAYEVAQAEDLPSSKRDVFLDNDRSVEAITARLKEALNDAQKHGHAVAIGHPYAETLTVLENVLPALAAEKNITLVRASAIVDRPQTTLLSMHNSDPAIPGKQKSNPKL